jgi:hypothetical protein
MSAISPIQDDQPVERSQDAPAAAPRWMRWTGRVLSGIATLFMIFDGTLKVLALQPAVEGTVQLGYPESAIVPMGIVVLAGVALYVVPRTSALGALLLTGFLGGAVATHVRVDSPLFSHTLFPIYIATLLWLGLWLRDERVRALLPVRRAR